MAERMLSAEDYGSPQVKRQRKDTHPQAQPLHNASDSGYHQGASFGLNFVTFGEYSGLRSEHDKLQTNMESLRKCVEETHNSLRTEITMMREENKKLKEEVRCLRSALENKGLAVGDEGGGGEESQGDLRSLRNSTGDNNDDVVLVKYSQEVDWSSCSEHNDTASDEVNDESDAMDYPPPQFERNDDESGPATIKQEKQDDDDYEIQENESWSPPESSTVQSESRVKNEGDEDISQEDDLQEDNSQEDKQISNDERLTSLENQIGSLRARLRLVPPAPTSEALKFLETLTSFYTSGVSTDNKQPLPSTPLKSFGDPGHSTNHHVTSSPVSKAIYGLLGTAPTPAPLTHHSFTGPLGSLTPLLQHPLASSSSGVASSALENVPALPDETSLAPWQPLSEEQLTPSQPVPEESPYSLKVQLLPKYNIWVNRSKLATLLQDSMGNHENAPLYLLRKLIPMVFSWQELAFSRGQGITTKSRDAGKAPLDVVKINACKDFMRLFCSQNALVEPPDTAINTVFTHTITYARTKIKRTLAKPNCKVSTLMESELSPLKSEDRLQYAEETSLDLSHFEGSSADLLSDSPTRRQQLSTQHSPGTPGLEGCNHATVEASGTPERGSASSEIHSQYFATNMQMHQ